MSAASNSLQQSSHGDRDAYPADVINRLNRQIDSLSLSIPDVIQCKADVERAKTVNASKEKREDILEKQRVSDVVAENTPTKQIFECLVCSKEVEGTVEEPEETQDTSDMRAKVGFTLNLCMECHADYVMEGCALCGAKRPNNDGEVQQATIQLAQNGHAWAQFEAGLRLYNKSKTENVLECKKQAEEFLLQASANGNLCATVMLAHLYGGIAPSESLEMENKDDCRQYLEAAAEHGDMKAQFILSGCLYKDGNEVEAGKWCTLSAHQGSPRACHNLASLFAKGLGGLEVSLERAKLYYEVAAKHGIPESQFCLSETIFLLEQDLMHITGYSCIPRCLYWARKAHENGYPADRLINEIERIVESKCAQCLARNPEGGCCGHCHSAWYCSRDCQRKHWINGYKIDCFKGE